MGAIAVIVLLTTWFEGPSIEMGESGKALEEAVREMITIREGLYLYGISAIALIAGGVLEFKEK